MCLKNGSPFIVDLGYSIDVKTIENTIVRL